MTWEIHTLTGSLGEWRQDWDRLNLQLFRANPYFDSRFVEPLLSHFASGRERLCVHRRNGFVDGLLLLMPRRTGTWSSFLPSQAQVAPVLLTHPEDLSTLFAALPGFVWCLELLNQDPDYSTTHGLPVTPLQDWSDHALTIKVSLDKPFDEYWKGLSKKLQSNIKRYIKRATEAGHPPHLVHLSLPEDVMAGLGRYGDLESAGWKGQAGTAICRGNEQGRFYEDVLNRFAEHGQCSVYELYFGDRLMASRLCVASDDMVVMLKTSYDESQSAFAPGRILLYLVLREEFQRARTQAIEFYTDATQDQIQWSTGQRRIRHLTLYRNTTAQQLTDRLKGLKSLLRPPKPPELREYSLTEELPTEVQDLFRQAETAYSEWGLEWFRLIADHALPTGQQARLMVTGPEGDTPLAALPVRYDGRRKRLQALTTFYSSLFVPLAPAGMAQSALTGLFAALASRSQGWSSLLLAPLDREESRLAHTLQTMRQAGWLAFPYFAFGNWYLPCRGLSFADYFASRPSQLRHTAERKERKFLADGRGTLTLVQGGDALEAGIASYEQIYRASWKVQEPFPDFMPALIRTCAARGWLRLGLAHYDGEPVAAQVWIVSAGRACIYKMAYNEIHGQLSPGTVLSKYLMHHVLDQDKVEEVDYLIGDDDYKKDWMSHRRERWGIVAYNPRTLAGLFGAIRETTGRLIKQILGKSSTASP